MRIQLVLVLPRDAASVPLARHVVSAALKSDGVKADSLDEVELVLTEACTNVFRHAGDDANCEVAINFAGDQLTIDVVDFGSGFGRPQPAGEMPDPEAEGGRGMALMKALTDQAIFDSVSGDGTAVHLVKRVRLAPPTPPLDDRDTSTFAPGRPSGPAQSP